MQLGERYREKQLELWRLNTNVFYRRRETRWKDRNSGRCLGYDG
ncbi:hypothetical protein RSAG8_05639, partial [Rhizoctonia solani AG-8 WAC10335]